jgi:hypothetical protein
MRSPKRSFFRYRRNAHRLRAAWLIALGGCNACISYGQAPQYPYDPYAGQYPQPSYQAPAPAPVAYPVPQLAQNPYATQQQSVYQLPPPVTLGNPQSSQSDYQESLVASGNNIFQYSPSPGNNPTREQPVRYSQDPEELNPPLANGESQTEESNAELIVGESLGPAVDEDSWIHGSWRSFCLAGCIAGVEGTFLSLQTGSLRSIVAGDLIQDQTFVKTPEEGFGAGYRTWVGMQNGAIGFRIVYWSFENSFYEPSPNFVPWNSFAFYDSSMLKAQTLDVEFLQKFCLGNSTVETSLGARYASLDRSGLLQGAGKLGGVNLLGSSTTNCELEGWGGIASIGCLIPIFCKEDLAPGCYHPWSLFWKCQGSALQAQSKVQAITMVNAIPAHDKFASAYSRDEAIADWEGMIGIGMLQVGLDYRCPVSWINCEPAAFHLRSGFEGQYWQTGDISVRSQSVATLEGEFDGSEFGGAITTKADANPEDIVLLGFFISASLSY